MVYGPNGDSGHLSYQDREQLRDLEDKRLILEAKRRVGGNASNGALYVYGVGCSDPEEQSKAIAEVMEKLGDIKDKFSVGTMSYMGTDPTLVLTLRSQWMGYNGYASCSMPSDSRLLGSIEEV